MSGTAIVRGENHTVATQVIKKDLFDLTISDLEDLCGMLRVYIQTASTTDNEKPSVSAAHKVAKVFQ